MRKKKGEKLEVTTQQFTARCLQRHIGRADCLMPNRKRRREREKGSSRNKEKKKKLIVHSIIR